MNNILNRLILVYQKIIEYTFGKFFPISYARWLGVTMGKNCRMINVKYSTEPYLIKIGDHVSATSVHFENHDGGVWCLRNKDPKIDIVKPIVIGDNVYIGFGAVILPGVNIGNNVIIGACALVSKNIPSNSVAAGVPARVIKTFNEYKAKAELVGDKTKHLTKKEKKKYYRKKYNM